MSKKEEVVTLKIKRLRSNVKLPAFKSKGAACFDLYSPTILVIPPRQAATIPLGIASEIPEGYEVVIRTRSGHAFDFSLQVHLGTIDSDYRGEWMVKVFNHSSAPYVVREGERIAQGALREVPKVEIVEVDELSKTERGTGGFGSTGR
jgi:dUTP pyrophosphatase